MSHNTYTSRKGSFTSTFSQGCPGEIYNRCACDGRTADETTYDKNGAIINHSVDRNITTIINGVTVPLYRTARTARFKWYMEHDYNYLFLSKPAYGTSECGGWRVNSIEADAIFTISENASVTSTKILYLDLDNGVALLHESTRKIIFDGSNSKHGYQQWDSTQDMAGQITWEGPCCIVTYDDITDATAHDKYYLIKHDGTVETLYERNYEWIVNPGLGIPNVIWNCRTGDYSPFSGAQTAVANVWKIINPPCAPTGSGICDHGNVNVLLYPEALYQYTCNRFEPVNSLMESDGGQDFFYPEWVRQLGPDPYYSAEAAKRIEVLHSGVDYESSVFMPDLLVDYMPCGNYVVDKDGNYFYSFSFYAVDLEDSDQQKLYVFNSHNGEIPNLPEAVIDKKAEFTAYYPLGLL